MGGGFVKVEKISSIRTLPPILEKEINQYKSQEYYDSFIYKDDLYLVASLGIKHTLGYDISIINLKEIDTGKWEVFMDKTEPGKGQILAQAISTPLTIAKIIIMTKGKNTPKEIVFKDKKGHIIKGVKVKIKES